MNRSPSSPVDPRGARRLRVAAVAAAVLATAAARGAESLVDAEPFDVVVLRAGGDPLEVEPLDLPPGGVPTPPPARPLVVRTLENPGEPLVIAWSAIARVETFPARLLAEANRLTRAEEFAAAFDHFARLERDYAGWPGAGAAFRAFLRADALDRFRAGEPDHALAILHALYQRAPEARGVRQAVDAVGGRILREAWRANDFRVVGSTLVALRERFGDLRPTILAEWEGRLDERAKAAAERAEAALAAGEFEAARSAAREALGLRPDAPWAADLLQRIDDANPTARVAVILGGPSADRVRLDTPAARRRARLVGGCLARLDDYAPSGGVYSSPLGSLAADAASRSVRLRLADESADAGRGPYVVARTLLALSGADAHHALAERTRRVSVERPAGVAIDLERAHARPEALLKGPLPAGLETLEPRRWTADGADADADVSRAVFRRADGVGAYRVLEERLFGSEQAAVDALLRGDVQVLANLPPWRVAPMRRARDIAVGAYRLPTTHCLFVAPTSYLAESRAARRSLCYGLARQRFVDDILLAGDPIQGFQALSAPLPAGRSLGDPLRYAYNDQIEPRPYQPRLAALLAAVARKEAAGDEDAAAEPAPLVVLHPPTPVARLACQSIEAQLEGLGLAVDVVEASEREIAAGGTPHDLRYAELTIGEPMVDAWTLFGPGGLAGDCSATLLAALERVDAARNGKDAAEALQATHEVLNGDLPIIPLWQTVDHYAFRTGLAGLPEETVDLYQTIDDWRPDTRARRP